MKLSSLSLIYLSATTVGVSAAEMRHVSCTVYVAQTLMINPADPDTTWYDCEEDGGSVYMLEGVEGLESGQVFSGLVDYTEESRTIMASPGNYEITESVNDSLTAVSGEKDFLIVYVNAPDATNNRVEQDFVNSVFGICDANAGCTEGAPDPVNLNTQMKACSANKLIFNPAACPSEATSCFSNNLLVNGAMTVDITQNIVGVRSGTVKDWAQTVVYQKLNENGVPSSTYNTWYFMYIFSHRADWGGAAAWAYLPGRVSAFRDDYAYRVGVQVHELGHNIGLHHSGFGTASYADHSCSMGNPSYGDDGPQVCFNGAKNYETKWFEEHYAELEVIDGDGWQGLLVGIDDFSKGKTDGRHTMGVKIVDPTDSQDLYVMYNRNKGINGGASTKFTGVTVVSGSAYKVSWYRAQLDEDGDTYTKAGFGTGSLVVKVCEFTYGDVDTARVLVHHSSKPLSCSSATNPPTASPRTSSPTKSPTRSPRTPSPTRSPRTSSPTRSPKTQSPTRDDGPKTQSPTGDNDGLPLSWNITMVNANDGTNDEGKPTIEVLYESSDRDFRVDVFEQNCETSTDVFPVQSDKTDSVKDGFIDVNVELTIDQDKLEDSPLWEGNGFSFCMAKSLLAPDETVVTKKYTIFRVSVDNQAGFDINGITVEAGEVEEENLSMSYKGTVKAYQCDKDTYERVNDDTVLGPFDTLNVCVEVDTAEEPGVVVSGILDFKVTQQKTLITFLALENGNTDPNWTDLVSTKCNDNGICMVRVQLFNPFFDDPQVLNVDGVATLGGTSRKLNLPVRTSSLRGESKQERLLQEDNEFNLSVGLAKPCKEGSSAKSMLRKVIKQGNHD